MAKCDYDLIVLGGGSGGLTSAKLGVGFGKKTAIIEKNKLGGECTWGGCVPSKALIKAAEFVHNKNQTEKLSFFKESTQKINGMQVMDFIRGRVQQVYKTHTPEEIKKAGIDVLFGSPRFVDKHTVLVDGKKITAKKFVITTGSSPFVPPVDGLEKVPYLTNQNLFDLETLPESLLILGGGPIGTEMASAFNRLGVPVTVVEMAETIMPREDKELAKRLQEKLTNDGILFKTQTRVIAASATDVGVEFTCAPLESESKNEGITFKLRAQKCLIATGRKPNIDGLDLQKAGVRTNKHGVIVNKKLRTSARNIYACGDVIGSYQFSHVAWQQAIVATRNALVPIFKEKINYKNILWVTFSAPEFAAAGLTEQQARETCGANIKIYKQEYGDTDRGVIDLAESGVAKFICDKKGRLVGAHILGARAGELIHELQLAKALGIKFATVGKVLHAYPAYSDVVWKAAKKARLDKLQNNFFVRLYRFLRKG